MGIAQDKGLRFAIIFLFLLNFLTGLVFVNEGLFHFDSVFLAQAVEKTYNTGILQPACKGRYGSVITAFLVSLPFFISGCYSDLVINFSSILFHSLSIVVLFLFVKELFNDDRQAFYCALLFSFTPFYFIPNTYGKEHGVSIFFLILSFLILYKGLNKKSPIFVGLSALIFVFALTTRESILIATPLFFLLFFLPKIEIHPLKIVFSRESLEPKLLFSFVLSFLTAFSFIFFAYLRHEIYGTLFVNSTSLVRFEGLLSSNFYYALIALYKSIPLIVFILFIVGIFKMVIDSKLSLVLFLSFWFILIFYIANTKAFCPRYLDIVIIPVYVFSSYALSKLYAKNPIIVNFMVLYMVISMLLFMVPMLSFRNQYNGEKQFALFVKEKTENNAVILEADDAPFIEYYAKRKALTLDLCSVDKANRAIAVIKEYLKKGIPVYISESALMICRAQYFWGALLKNFHVTTTGKKAYENYHRPETRINIFYLKLFKVQIKGI